MQTALQTLQAAGDLVLNEKADEASSLLKRFLEDRDHPGVWYKLAQTVLIEGDEVVARALLRNVWRQVQDPHVLDLITARIPVGKPHVFDRLKLMYFSIPKCGSSTIKDAFLVAGGKKAVGELSHHRTSSFAKVIPFNQLPEKFSDYTKFTVLRHPRERLRSYWRKNISEARSLLDEARGRDVFYGLPTAPSYETFIDRFHDYRRVFRDFRHHTDSAVGFLGRQPERIDHVFGMHQLNEAIALISERSGTEIPPLRNMRSSGEPMALSAEAAKQEADLVAEFYRDEIAIFHAEAVEA